jgi:ABC-type arginine transport system ATPase subunit
MICIIFQTNCQNTFIDYIGVTKFLHPARKVTERVVYITHPHIGYMGRSISKWQDAIAGKQKED